MLHTGERDDEKPPMQVLVAETVQSFAKLVFP
jgi:hypothetical protein